MRRRIWLPEDGAPFIIPHRTREIQVPGHGCGIAGHFSWELTRRGVVLAHGRAKNVITNAAMDAMASLTNQANNLTGWAAVGTLNTPPAADQTTLGAEVGRTARSTGQFQAGQDFEYHKFVSTYLFTEAQANGNLQELGLFSANPGGTMFCRQLFQDDLGNPVTIVKTNEDQLKIVYEFRVYPQQVADTVVINVNGTDISCSTRAYRINDTLIWGLAAERLGQSALDANRIQVGEVNTMPSLTEGVAEGRISGITRATAAAYTPGSLYIDVDHQIDPGIANFPTGIGHLRWWMFNTGVAGTWGATAITTFTPKIPKGDTQRLILTGRMQLARR